MRAAWVRAFTHGYGVLGRGTGAGAALVAAALLAWCPVAAAAEDDVAIAAAAAEAAELGERLYAQQCASCHGDSGEGVRGEYSKPLAGEMTLPRLGDYIDRWMPEEDPDQVTGDDAEAVARYIYAEFYSPIAQVRNRPARVELARLTADQHRNAVADLVGGFRSPPAEIGDQRGLRARYYNGRRPRGDADAERIDERVELRFTGGGEVAEELEPIGFAARWQGSLIVPETGTYQLTVNTDHAARLWLNSLDEPLIDAWVVSRGDTEHTASVFLVGGRAYPLRLDFSSYDQGVSRDDPDAEPVEGFLELQWKQPKHMPEVIPSRHLSPDRGREELVVETPFPPEDRSVGYERGASISRAWHRAATDAAIEAATYIADHLDELTGGGEDDAEREAALRDFAERFVERAFRRPLDERQREQYIDRHFEAVDDPETAVRRVVLLTLMSPRFLYLDFGTEAPDEYELASRLSFTLWDSVPDEQLREAAASGRLASPDELRREAERMVADPRTRHKMRQFFHHWLHLGHNEGADKAADYFPDFDERIVSDLRTSLYLFLEAVVWGDDPDFRRLMDADELYINGRLAEYYGFDLPADAPFEKLPADHPQRRGVVSHPYVMAVFAYHDTTSPIHRGVNLARGMLGRTLRPPPEAFTPDPAEDHPDLTTRERIARQTAPDACASCHTLINPLGFTLEHFDAVGRFRQAEGDDPIDSTGGYELPSGEKLSFQDARDLADYLAGSEEAHEAFVLQLFHHMVKQPIRGYGQERPAQMADDFAAQGFDIRRLIAEIATTAALAGADAERVAATQRERRSE